ncbi:hypothetical protein L2E82_30171 [Cichorium intybus]|uniref:Uncharacterized protein n=1 Tax=Cichorium intybus TaxID=13427 RepID=A0ACB9CZZ3_CICIN|nr:hypothetical protein L2E82_30171 [Cichorium intybus]
MFADMSFDLENGFKSVEIQARRERSEIVKSHKLYKLEEGTSVCTHVHKIKSYIDRLDNLGVHFPKELATDVVLNSLPRSYRKFIMNYDKNHLHMTLIELHGMLKTAEASLKKSCSSSSTAPVLVIRHDDAKKKKLSHPRGNGRTMEG